MAKKNTFIRDSERQAWRASQSRMHESVRKDSKGRITHIHRWKLPRSGVKIPDAAMMQLANVRSNFDFNPAHIINRDVNSNINRK